MKKGTLNIERRLTNSLRNLWTGCHRRFYYSAVERLEPIVTARALQLGTMVHVGLAEHYAAKMDKRPGDIEGAVLRRLRDYEHDLEALDDEDAAKAALEESGANADLAFALLGQYFETWDDRAWTVLAVEVPLEIRLKTPRGTSSHWTYRGTLDLVVFDHTDGLVKIVDHKTSSHGNKERFTEELMLDPQSPGYCMLLASHPEIYEEWGPIGTFVFNVLRSKLPAEPKTLVCKKCNNKLKKDRTFSDPGCPTCRGTNVSGLSKAQGVDTTPEKFREALRSHPHLDPSDYEEVFQRLEIRADSWMYRVELDYTPEQLGDFHAESYEITRSISEANYWDRDFGSCFRPGRRCAMRSLCLAESTEAEEEARRAFRIRKQEVDEDTEENIMEPDGSNGLPF